MEEAWYVTASTPNVQGVWQALPAMERSPTSLLHSQVSGHGAKPSKLPQAESR